MSEDQHWDLRFRDLRGKEIWNLRLEEVQQARSLARLLRMKIAVQIADRDYDGFARSMQAGFRLSAFVGQGESLVQCLVGVAIENVLYEALPLAIRSPDAPNFYWALRTLPPELNELRSAVEVELSMAHRTFPILDEAEIVRLSDAELVRRVNQDMSDLHELSRSEASVRTQMIRRRLMVVEALRMLAADHHGQLPKSLAELKGTPVDLDPFSDSHFGCRVETLPEGQRVILTSQVPEFLAMLREFTCRFPAARR